MAIVKGKPDISSRIFYTLSASQLGATGFDRGRNDRRDACRAGSVQLVIKKTGKHNCELKRVRSRGLIASERLRRKLLKRADGDVTLVELARGFGP